MSTYRKLRIPMKESNDNKENKENKGEKESLSSWLNYDTKKYLPLSEAMYYFGKWMDEWENTLNKTMSYEQRLEFIKKYSRDVFPIGEEVDGKYQLKGYQLSVDGLWDDVREYLGIEDEEDEEEE